MAKRDATALDILTMQEAARYLGCSPNFVSNLRRLGWLQSIAELEYLNIKQARKDCRFYRWQIDQLAWDVAMSLSFFDVLIIRQSDRDNRYIARRRGLPLRVVAIVQSAQVFGWIVELQKRYARRRTGKSILGFDVVLPLPPDPLTLPRLLFELTVPHSIEPNPGGSSPTGKSHWMDAGAPGGVAALCERHIFGLRGAARRGFARNSLTWSWNRSQLESSSPHAADRKPHELPTEQPCQKPLPPEDMA